MPVSGAGRDKKKRFLWVDCCGAAIFCGPNYDRLACPTCTDVCLSETHGCCRDRNLPVGGLTVPRVSVIIPTYNSAWSVGRTLRSVLHQTLRDFEVIVVNDGSTDDFADAVAPFEGDERVRIVHQANMGLAAARNRGIAEARSALIAPIDADDLWHPDFLAETVSALEGDPDAPFAFAYSFRMDERDFIVPYVTRRRPPRHDFIGLLSLNSVSCGSAGVYRRYLMLRWGGYDEAMGHAGLQGAEDWKMILRLASLGEPILIERYLVGYRLVPSGMSQIDPGRQLAAVLAVVDDIDREVPGIPRKILADAETMMRAWLLPAFAHQRLYGRFLVEAFKGYALNPLWFLNAPIRQLHWYRLEMLFRSIGDRLRAGKAKPLHLSEAVVDGRKPFAYLSDDERAPASPAAPRERVAASHEML